MTASPADPRPGCRSARRHDTLTARTQDGCRCPAAVDAHNDYEKRRVYDAAQGRPRMVDAVGTVRRLRALMAIGWPTAKLAAELGVSPHWIRRLAGSRRRVRVGTAESVTSLYERLGGHPGPSAVTVGVARRLGYVPPIGWDDDDLDDPAARPWQERLGSGVVRTATDKTVNDLTPCRSCGTGLGLRPAGAQAQYHEHCRIETRRQTWRDRARRTRATTAGRADGA